VAEAPRPTATNWAQARDQIDSGATGDKVGYPDPATTPLGTDAEAGGSSTPPEVIAQNVRNEQQTRPARGPAHPKVSMSPWLFVGVGAVALVIVVLLVAG
jgi:hypothetical protein